MSLRRATALRSSARSARSLRVAARTAVTPPGWPRRSSARCQARRWRARAGAREATALRTVGLEAGVAAAAGGVGAAGLLPLPDAAIDWGGVLVGGLPPGRALVGPPTPIHGAGGVRSPARNWERPCSAGVAFSQCCSKETDAVRRLPSASKVASSTVKLPLSSLHPRPFPPTSIPGPEPLNG